MTSIEMENPNPNTSNNNEEESIFLTSSDDDKEQERDVFDDASDNDDYAYGNAYSYEDRSQERRPIKVYDEYDPENIDNNDDDSDDDLPLNMYSRNRKQKPTDEKDSDIEEVYAESSSDDDKTQNAPKKRGRPKRNEPEKLSKKPKNISKKPIKPEMIKKAKKIVRKDSSDSSSVSSIESESKVKQVKKTKENVNTESINKNLVKKQPVSMSLKPKVVEHVKSTTNQAQSIISGRVINFESGFKIPKRPR